MENFYRTLVILMRIAVVLTVSGLIFYFFETPCLIETAFAEESLSENSSTKETSNNNIGTQAEGSEPSFIKKVGYFLGDYKGYLLLTGVIIGASVYFYGGVDAPPPPNLPLPAGSTFIEDTNFKYSVEAVKDLPEHFKVTKGVFADEAMKHLSGVFVDNPNTQVEMCFRVYPTKPILHEDPSLSILVNQHQAVPVVLTNNPYGFSNEPSMEYWVNHAKALYPMLNELQPSFVLQYQKVALADPSTLNYAYFHQVSLVPTNIDTLSTPFETKLNEQLLRVYLFKDNEAGGQ